MPKQEIELVDADERVYQLEHWIGAPYIYITPESLDTSNAICLRREEAIELVKYLERFIKIGQLKESEQT